MDPTLPILPQIFQQFNPFFVVALTPVSLAVFGSLAKKGKEPSAPRKIGIGMVIAAVGVITLQVKQRWYAREMNDLEYLYKVISRQTAEKE